MTSHLPSLFRQVDDGAVVDRWVPFANTETAQLADVVLPSAMWGEKTGCMTNAERRCTLLRKAVNPLGEARADLDIFLDFGSHEPPRC